MNVFLIPPELVTLSDTKAKEILEARIRNKRPPHYFGDPLEMQKIGFLGQVVTVHILKERDISCEMDYRGGIDGAVPFFDITILGKRYEIKTGRCNNFDLLPNINNYDFLVKKSQYDRGDFRNVIGYLSIQIDKDYKRASFMGWERSWKIKQYLTRKEGLPTTSYRVPFANLLKIEDFK